ncbi:MAG TPA: hypothetical protein VK166_07880 [Chitinophagaceae bacterium]|nr:hypothetical protein [Chitinophagaceae bacterium]
MPFYFSLRAIRILILVMIMGPNFLFAQDTTKAAVQDIDPSKPTNLYTQINANLEYQAGKNQNLFGLRTNVQYAFNPDNLVLVELPFLYNDRTSKFGVGDMRIRYFNAIKRNISPSFIAIAPFADITVPIGSYEDGIGSSVWSLAGGVVFGFIATKKLSLFPGISYVHITKPSSDIIPENLKSTSDGIGLQFNASYSFNKTTFLFINPTPSFLNTNGNWRSIWSGELNLNKIVIPNKLKVNAFWGPNFTNDIHVFRMGATFFL